MMNVKASCPTRTPPVIVVGEPLTGIRFARNGEAAPSVGVLSGAAGYEEMKG